MNLYRVVGIGVIIVSGVYNFSMIGQSASTMSLQEEEITVPLFGRQRLDELKEVKTLHKRLLLYIQKYKRCLFTGPCTKQEITEIRRDIKKIIIGIVLVIGVGYIVKRQRQFLQKKGIEPKWWKIPWQYYQYGSGEVKKTQQSFKKTAKSMKKAVKIVGQLGDDGVTGNLPYMGEFNIKVSGKKPKPGVVATQQPAVTSQQQRTPVFETEEDISEQTPVLEVSVERDDQEPSQEGYFAWFLRKMRAKNAFYPG